MLMGHLVSQALSVRMRLAPEESGSIGWARGSRLLSLLNTAREKGLETELSPQQPVIEYMKPW